MLVDTHAHLDMEEYEEDLCDVLNNASQNGVSTIITIGVDVSSSLRGLELARKYDWIFCSVGCHPHHARGLTTESLSRLSLLVPEKKIVAWGEIGLDFYRRYSPPDKQVEAFVSQLDVAVGHGLPIIIHSREANLDVFEIVKKRGTSQKGVLHCFSGDYELAMKFIDLGYLISIPGTVTYPKADNVRDVAGRIPLDHLLLETDAPFLAPVPKRGRRNEPKYLIYTAKKVAEIRGMDLQEIARHTTENARRLFGIP